MSGRDASKLSGETDYDKLQDLVTRTYKEQAIWFLNGYWDTWGKDNAEKLWDYVHKCNDLDLDNHENGCALDEMKAHMLLEAFNETLTVRKMREELRGSGAITDKRLKAVPLSHLLIVMFNVSWNELIKVSQGGNQQELLEAQKKLDEVMAALEECKARDAEAAAALQSATQAEATAKKAEADAHAAAEAAKKTEAEAKAAAEESKVKEAEAKAAQQELEAALAELKAQEDAYNNKTEELKRKSEEGGVVSRNRAKNELAQHLGEDPLPLRRAKINQEAAVRKAEKAANAAAEARVASENAAAEAEKARIASEQAAAEATVARQEAEQKRAASEEAKAAAAAAVEDALNKYQAAEEYLEEVKSKPGSSDGALWWMDRELHEQKKYLPEKKGGIAK